MAISITPLTKNSTIIKLNKYNDRYVTYESVPVVDDNGSIRHVKTYVARGVNGQPYVDARMGAPGFDGAMTFMTLSAAKHYLDSRK